MKKIIVGIIVMLGLFGCSSNNKDDVLKVGIVQNVQHDSLDTIRNAFEKEMKKNDKVEIMYKNASGDVALLDSLSMQLVNDGADVIVAIATPSAQAAAKYAGKVPIIFSAVSDPVAAGLVSDMNKPDKNITGTSDEIQISKILELSLKMYPDTKKVGFLYNASEVNSKSNLDKAKKFASENNLTIVEAPISSASDTQQRVQTLVKDVDIVFAPNDNKVASSMDLVTSILNKAKKPFFVGADSMVRDGGLATVGIDYDQLGIETAKMVEKVLAGTPVSEIPVMVFNEDLNTYFNVKTAKLIGFDKDINKIADNVIEVK